MRLLKRLIPYLKPYRGGLLLGFTFVTLANLAGAAMPWLVGRAIDTLALPGTAVLLMVGYAGLIVLVTAFSGAARFGMRKQLNGISRRVEVDLRNDVFAHMLGLDAGFYARMPTGELISRLTNDTQAVRMAIGPGLMYMANTIVLTALALGVMFAYSVRLTLISLVPLGLLGPAMLYFGRVIHKKFERIQQHFGVLSTMVQENLSGVRVVRAYVQESAQEKDFERLNREYFDRNMSLARTSAMFRPVLAGLVGVGALCVLWFGGFEVMAGRMTAGSFVAFFFYLGLLAWPMTAIGWVVNLFQRGAASLGRIAGVLDSCPLVADPPAPVDPFAVSGNLAFDDVWFRYPGTERDVLRGVSFRIQAGETAALVGPTGSGKSTIAALLTRRYDPTSGSVLLDGVPLWDLPLNVLRDSVALVPQDAFVFSRSLRENIEFGLRPGKEANRKVEDATRIARLDDTVRTLPAGLDTRLGERGVNLSGGERQRATLARALAREAPVLILDDALSAVDTQTETRMLAGLRDVIAGRTALIVSHRVSAVMNADRIFVLDQGRIVEQGRHADLVAAGGLYVSLLRRQLLSDDLEFDPVAATAPASQT